ncbi:MAG: hypothetical protein J5529_11320, partial [Prevotella sp.]|nr:hypothetical protein [Prevotella sp.]
MKRTDKKMKAKDLRTRSKRYCLKYDRTYVTRHYGDATHAPIKRGCSDEWGKTCDNRRLHNYVYRFLLKSVGEKLDVVFHEFKKLGWKNSREMYHYWECYM